MNHHFFFTSIRNSRSWIVVLALALLTNITASQSWAMLNDGFVTDLKAAVEQAKEQDKDLLLLFTGSDWCPPCKMLEEEVFSQQEFLDGVSEDFVLVMLDFPKNKQLAQELKGTERFAGSQVRNLGLSDRHYGRPKLEAVRIFRIQKRRAGELHQANERGETTTNQT